MARAEKALCTVLVIAAALGLRAQPGNLVPNPGFEEYLSCPGDFSESAHEFSVYHWVSATSGTPDHFHRCSAGEANVPYNWAGVSDAIEGNGYAGIYVWMNNDNPYREYLQCRLLAPLIKDSLYHVGFRYKLSSYSKYAVDRIGLLLSDSVVREHHDNVLQKIPTLSIVHDSALTTSTGLWEKAMITYKARGGERHLIIGNFFDNETTAHYEILFRPASQPMLAGSAYYYIDDVTVIPAYSPADTLSTLPAFSLPDAMPNTTYVLDDIRFEFDSYKLWPSSFDQLDEVVAYIAKNPGARVRLTGHTDDLGSDRYNVLLSANRAKSVSAYLVYQGIDIKRIDALGLGKSRPLVNDSTEQARSINRRVEIRFIR